MGKEKLRRVASMAMNLAKWVALGLGGIFILIFMLLALDRDYGQVYLSDSERASIQVQKNYNPKAVDTLYSRLLSEYGNNKTLAPGFEIQCLIALSHYPELKETSIDFIVKPAFLPLASRPQPASILFPWVKRKYLVVISNESTDFFEPILLENTPLDEQVGIIGHELGHTVFYLDKSALQIARIGFCYLFDEYIRKFERETDKLAIAHGLGYQMYDFAFFVRKAYGNTKEEILAEKGGWYLSPREIELEMSKYEFYREELDSEESYFEVVEVEAEAEVEVD